jgi:L-aminopeptidase/D-esterase-like protein
MASPTVVPSPLPPFPEPTDRLDLDGFRLGHAADRRGLTGLTVVLVEDGARAAAQVLGSATGTRQFDSLVHPHHVGTRAHAVVLAGGSGYGLAAADAVVDDLASRGHGFATGARVVPIVPTAILFDLAFGDPEAAPDRRLATAALADARERSPEAPVPMGSVGAGTGATVGKSLGPDHGMKGGFGFASLTGPTGVTVAAAVEVNAFGDVRDPATGEIVAGCRTSPDGTELADASRVLAALPPEFGHTWEGNTTLAVVMTDADLPRTALAKVCQMAFGGFYRTLAPALSLYDGDLVVALSRGERQAHVNQVGVLAEAAVAAAILEGVRRADGFGLLPAAGDL